jgi:hypothetical protein
LGAGRSGGALLSAGFGGWNHDDPSAAMPATSGGEHPDPRGDEEIDLMKRLLTTKIKSNSYCK